MASFISYCCYSGSATVKCGKRHKVGFVVEIGDIRKEPYSSDTLYLALGIIALVFSILMVSNRTHAVRICRDLEIAPTGFGASVRLETAPT